jgi:FG-GAP repeat
VAMGAPDNDENSEDAGYVRIFDWKGNEWKQVGEDIDGEENNDAFGWSVALSSDDGRRVAVGAVWNDGNGDASGHVRIYNMGPFS